jgi:hypothetical protein
MMMMGAQRFDWNEEFKKQTLRAKMKWVVMKSWSKMEDDDDDDGDRMKSLRSKHWGKKKKWVMMKSRRKFENDEGGGGGGGQRFNWMSFCSKLTSKLLRKKKLGVMEK